MACAMRCRSWRPMQTGCLVLQVGDRYRPFNLLTFDANAAVYLGHRPVARSQAIAPGVHGLFNVNFNTPWPKTRTLMQRLQQCLEREHEDGFEDLFDALVDEDAVADADLPDTGIGLFLAVAVVCLDSWRRVRRPCQYRCCGRSRRQRGNHRAALRSAGSL